MDQQPPIPFANRRMTAVHVRKYRGIRASPGRTSPCRSVSTPTSQFDSIATDRVHGEHKSMQFSLSIDPAYAPYFPHLTANTSMPHGHALPTPQRSSAFSSRIGSGYSQWSQSNSQSSASYSMTDMSSLTTPVSTFSYSDSSFHNSQHVPVSDPSSSHSEPLSLGADKFSSGHDALGTPQRDGRPTLWVNTTMDGNASDICLSPVDDEPRETPPYLQADYQVEGTHNASTIEQPKSDVHGAFFHGGAYRPQTFPTRVNTQRPSDLSGVGSPPSLEHGHSERGPKWCRCHWLLVRPSFASPESEMISKICRLYSQRMRYTRHTTIQRLQDEFKVMWQKNCQTVPGLQWQVQEALEPILDRRPTIEDSLMTLITLSVGCPVPSLHGYISLAFFAKAWLSLEEQQGLADVTDGLFYEMVRCVTAMADSDDERHAYDLLLQMIWQPNLSTMSPLEQYPRFCPVPSQIDISTFGTNFRATATTNISPMLSHVCEEMVNVLVPKIRAVSESLSPAVHGTHTDPIILPVAVRKIHCLWNMMSNSGDRVLAIRCPECRVVEFTGSSRRKNLNKHLESDCPITRKGPDYQRASCPFCQETYSRRDNMQGHIKRKHQGEKRTQSCPL